MAGADQERTTLAGRRLERLRGRDYIRPGSPSLDVIEVRDQVRYEAHRHDFVELVLIVSGEGMHQTVYGMRPLRPGQVLVLLPGDWHAYRRGRGLRYFNLILGMDFINTELAWSREDPVLAGILWTGLAGEGGPGPQVHQLTSAKCKQLQGQLVAIRKRRREAASSANRCRVLAHVLEALAIVADGVRRARPKIEIRPVHSAVTRAVAVIESHLDEPWTLKALAASAGLNPFYLIRLFREQTGLSPFAYLRRLRLERAAAMLMTSDARIAEIQERVGFADAAHFSRAFRRQFGLSPRAYREKNAPLEEG